MRASKTECFPHIQSSKFFLFGNSRVAQTIKLVRLGDFLNLKSSLEDALTYLKN